MQFFNELQNNLKQFARIFRYFSYMLLFLLFCVGIATGVHVHYQFLVFLLFIAVPVLQNEVIRRWVSRRYGDIASRRTLCLMDAIGYAFFIACFDQALVPSLVALLMLLFGSFWLQVGKLFTSLAVLLFMASYVLFCRVVAIDPLHFTQHYDDVLTIAAILCLATYLCFGVVFISRRLRFLGAEKTKLEDQVNRYLILANKLSRYAPTQIWQSIIRGEHDVKIDNKRRKLTIFFSDIQGFTELSDRLLPDDLAFILNDYFEHMTELARQYGGTVDKFMGDAILIFFGDPETKGAKEDAAACIEMALAMRQQMKVLRQRWQHAGYDGLHIRIGITTGYCHVGNFGTTSRMSYTIVGRDANLAARLQTAAAVDQILISNETYQLIQDRFSCVPNGQLQLKGLSAPVMTWQVIAKKDQQGQSRWLDCELAGFNLQLDMDQLKSYEGDKVIQVLEQASKRVRLEIMQQSHDRMDSRPHIDKKD